MAFCKLIISEKAWFDISGSGHLKLHRLCRAVNALGLTLSPKRLIFFSVLPEFLFISWLNGVRIRVMHGNDDAVFFLMFKTVSAPMRISRSAAANLSPKTLMPMSSKRLLTLSFPRVSKVMKSL
ncbi:hypothetical protein RBI80_14975 [Klebsiella variicola]|nr:hypothetical protein RBI80_14975 [Klebsiella variicola]